MDGRDKPYRIHTSPSLRDSIARWLAAEAISESRLMPPMSPSLGHFGLAAGRHILAIQDTATLRDDGHRNSP